MTVNYKADEIEDLLEDYQKKIGVISPQQVFLLGEAFNKGATPAMVYKTIRICQKKNIRNFSYFLKVLENINQKNDREP